MGLDRYLTFDALNSRLYEVLHKYDPDRNGFTKKELSNAIKDMTTIFAKGIMAITRYDKTIFKEIDTNKDDLVSYNELEVYAKNEFQLEFNSLLDLKIIEICNLIDKIKNNKNNE